MRIKNKQGFITPPYEHDLNIETVFSIISCLAGVQQ